MYDVAHLASPEAATALVEAISGVNIPRDWAQLYGPKIVAIPDKLFVGKYQVLIQIMVAFTLPSERTVAEDKKEVKEDEEGEQYRKGGVKCGWHFTSCRPRSISD